jgi:hypothetical protein
MTERHITRRRFVYGCAAAVPLVPFHDAIGWKSSRSPGLPRAMDRDDEVREARLLEAIASNPRHIRLYDALNKLYGKYQRYEEIYAFLRQAQKTLKGLVDRTPARYQRYRTVLRLIGERLTRVEAVRAREGFVGGGVVVARRVRGSEIAGSNPARPHQGS